MLKDIFCGTPCISAVQNTNVNIIVPDVLSQWRLLHGDGHAVGHILLPLPLVQRRLRRCTLKGVLKTSCTLKGVLKTSCTLKGVLKTSCTLKGVHSGCPEKTNLETELKTNLETELKTYII